MQAPLVGDINTNTIKKVVPLTKFSLLKLKDDTLENNDMWTHHTCKKENQEQLCFQMEFFDAKQINSFVFTVVFFTSANIEPTVLSRIVVQDVLKSNTTTNDMLNGSYQMKFNVKSPIIGCKYYENNILKRFQINFATRNDFDQIVDALTKTGVQVKIIGGNDKSTNKTLHLQKILNANVSIDSQPTMPVNIGNLIQNTQSQMYQGSLALANKNVSPISSSEITYTYQPSQLNNTKHLVYKKNDSGLEVMNQVDILDNDFKEITNLSNINVGQNLNKTQHYVKENYNLKPDFSSNVKKYIENQMVFSPIDPIKLTTNTGDDNNSKSTKIVEPNCIEKFIPMSQYQLTLLKNKIDKQRLDSFLNLDFDLQLQIFTILSLDEQLERLEKVSLELKAKLFNELPLEIQTKLFQNFTDDDKSFYIENLPRENNFCLLLTSNIENCDDQSINTDVDATLSEQIEYKYGINKKYIKHKIKQRDFLLNVRNLVEYLNDLVENNESNKDKI